MAWLPAGELFKTDWKDLAQVIALAKRFGPGMTVIKYQSRMNYNITHTSTLQSKSVLNAGLYEIVYQTQERKP